MDKQKDPTLEGLEEIYEETPEESVETTKKEIYFDPEAGSPDEEPASVSIKRRPAKKGSFKKAVLFLLLASFAVVGFLMWQAYNNISQPENNSSKDVVLKIVGPKEIISGETNEYQITLENNSQETIKAAEINLRLPQNFTASDFSQAPTNKIQPIDGSAKITQYFWEFSSIVAGAKKEIIISGQAFGEIGAKQTLTATCHYQPINFSSDFRTSSSFEAEIIDTLVSLKVSAQKQIISGGEIEYELKVAPSPKSSSTSTPVDLRLSVEYPDGFVLDKVVTKLDENTSADSPEGPASGWLIKNLNEEQTLTIIGALSGESGDYKEFRANIGYYINNDFELQASESFITLITKPELELGLEINEIKLSPYNADWGDEIKYSLTYANKSETDISDVILKLNFSGNDIIDWNSLDCDRASDCDFLLGTDENNPEKILTWTREQISDLATLAPGQSGAINLKLNLFEQSPNKTQKNFHNQAQAQADFKVADLKNSLEASSTDMVVKIKSQVSLETEVRYYTDENLKIGSGPLPPLVGAPTSFRIFWQASNTSNALKDLKIFTTLPNNVAWTDKTQALAGAISYDSSTRKVAWIISNLKPYSAGVATANFEVSVTPTSSQIGEYLPLTNETTLEATDDYVGEKVSDVQSALTSELEKDLYAQGKGRVE